MDNTLLGGKNVNNKTHLMKCVQDVGRAAQPLVRQLQHINKLIVEINERSDFQLYLSWIKAREAARQKLKGE